jgi:hypothetical protein
MPHRAPPLEAIFAIVPDNVDNSSSTNNPAPPKNHFPKLYPLNKPVKVVTLVNGQAQELGSIIPQDLLMSTMARPSNNCPSLSAKIAQAAQHPTAQRVGTLVCNSIAQGIANSLVNASIEKIISLFSKPPQQPTSLSLPASSSSEETAELIAKNLLEEKMLL